MSWNFLYFFIFQLAKNRNMTTIAARLKDACPNDTGKNIARDIVEMTYAVWNSPKLAGKLQKNGFFIRTWISSISIELSTNLFKKILI